MPAWIPGWARGKRESVSFDLNDAVRNTLALVLAGGRGSRLRALTDSLAKPAVPFGGKFRIVDFPLSNCLNSGVRRISVITQYRSHHLIRHIQRGWNFCGRSWANSWSCGRLSSRPTT